MWSHPMPSPIEHSIAPIVGISRFFILQKMDELTDWISPAFFVRDPAHRKKGKLRLVSDFSELNKYIQRPVHPFPSSKDIINQISSDSKVFIKLDELKGYFQIPMEENSSYLTTILLPTGKYRYKRAPMFLSSSTDKWNRHSDAAVAGLEGVVKEVDDIFIQAPDYPTLWKRLQNTMDRCCEHGITISKQKVEMGDTIKFMEYIISKEGISPDEKIQAIWDFPAPTDIPGVCSFLGLINQLTIFIPDVAHMTASIRALLKKEVAFL